MGNWGSVKGQPRCCFHYGEEPPEGVQRCFCQAGAEGVETELQEFVAMNHCCYSKVNTYFKLLLKLHCETEFKIFCETCHSVTPLVFRNQTQSHAVPPVCSLWSFLACKYRRSQRFKDKDFYVGVIAFLKPASISEESRWALGHVRSSGKMRWISNLTASQEQLLWV